jgi:hypothetical protein
MTVRRQEIIAEMIRRLSAAFSCEIKRGFGGMNVGTFPAVYIFEDDENTLDAASNAIPVARHRGVYNRDLPLVIEYFRKGRSMTDLYESGNEMLAELAQAIELDKYFANEKGTNLVNGYYQKSNAILPVRDGVVEVVVQYDFLYPAQQLGF